MSRVGNPFPPVGWNEPDVLHAWGAYVPGADLIEVLFGLERDLEDGADRLGRVLVSSPSYETFRPLDRHLPRVVLGAIPVALVTSGLPVVLVHGYAVTAPRNTRPLVHAHGALDAPAP